MKKVGFIGSRGMVGSVLMDLLKKDNTFSQINSYFFSTSSAGESAPKVLNGHELLLDAYNLEQLKSMDIIVTCQGGDYTKAIHQKLRDAAFHGFWIDAASTLRMNQNSLIVLDPINLQNIKNGLNNKVVDFVGGNCTVSLMLLALQGLIRENLIEWVSSMTYQAASGAGAKNMIELMNQYKFLASIAPSESALLLEKKIGEEVSHNQFPKDHFGFPLAFNLLPFIDIDYENGQSKEEWKGQVEANKILNNKDILKVDGTCVRVSALRCHSQGLTIKLKKDISLNTIEDLIKNGNEWVKFVVNTKSDTLKNLTPQSVTGTTDIKVGRVRKMTLGNDFLNVFTVGDQLLWGAALPLKRMLDLVI